MFDLIQDLLVRIISCLRRDEMRSTPSTDNESEVVIEVIGDLPYYVPIPENRVLAPSLIGAEPFHLEFQHFQPLRHPDDSQGREVDDRLGTFIRSKARVVFPVPELPAGDCHEDYVNKALNITNRALRVVKYLAFDHTIRHVSQFDSWLVRSWAIGTEGTVELLGEWSQQMSYGPFGIRLKAVLSPQGQDNLWWYFNDLASINPAWYLILDSKYHNAIGDISRAILDMATALEINIESLMDAYSHVHSDLNEIALDNVNIYRMYDRILEEAVDHSLHEQPDLFVALEYIRQVRNSIAHKWKPEFRIDPRFASKTKYLDQHKRRDGHLVTTKEEVSRMIDDATQIIDYTLELFKSKYGKI